MDWQSDPVSAVCSAGFGHTGRLGIQVEMCEDYVQMRTTCTPNGAHWSNLAYVLLGARYLQLSFEPSAMPKNRIKDPINLHWTLWMKKSVMYMFTTHSI